MIGIAYVIDTIEGPTAGTERQLLMLLKNLNRKYFSPHLILLRDSDWIKRSRFPCPVCHLNLPSFKSVHLIRALKTFREYCKGNGIGTVQTLFWDANIFGTLAAKLAGVNVVISSRRNYQPGNRHNKYSVRVLRLLRHITCCYIANSKRAGDYTVQEEKVDKDRMHVIYNGIELERFADVVPDRRMSYRKSLGIGPEQILIGAVSNLRPVKNLELFIKVASMLYTKYSHARFIIVGEGPERQNLEEMIEEYGLQNVFILAGQQNDVVPFLSSMDIGVLCSKSESLSNSIIEYMAAGLPCVVSEVGGNLEAIGYEHGFSFESDNEWDFFRILEELILDESLRLKKGRDAKAYAFEHYDHGQVVRQHEEIYERYHSGPL
jgi:glycosyltransferase involved in cell wall biosynthesis